MKKNNLSLVLLSIIIILLTPFESTALEQILNGNFSAGTANWTPVTFVSQPNDIDIFGQLGTDGAAPLDGCFQAQYTDANGPAGLLWYADGEVYQAFPAAIASDTNARIKVSYRENHASNNRAWFSNLLGTIRREDTPAIVVDTFLNIQNTGTNSYDSAWITLPDKTILLPGGLQYRMYFYINLGAEKQADPQVLFDQVSCNMSPSGLVASETTLGGCQLNWPDSAVGTPALAGANGYRIYRKTLPTDPWVQIGTSNTSTYTDATPPSAEYVYYCVSDVDTIGVESPYSPEAIFKTAKLLITDVEVTPSTVTRGQSGIPIKVYIENPGYSTARLDEVALYFSTPEVGTYSIVLTSSLPVILAGGASTVVNFSIDVLEASIPETDVIDAIATGTNLQTGATITDTESDSNHSWLIRSPANLVIQTITTPSAVYRDQKDVPVSIEVLNDGAKNAAAYWESTEFLFSSGTYTNIRAVDPMPATVYAGLTQTINYLVDVEPTCATGPCVIDANIDFRDVNLLISSTNFDGAAVPGEWIVVAGIIRTYKGPPLFPIYTIEADSFNQSVTTVYASAANLIPLSEYRFRWFDPSSTQVRVTDPPLTTDLNGVINDQFILNAASPLGQWRITATRVSTTIPLAEANFDVVSAAAMSVQLTLPQYVTLDQNFIATMSIINTGGAQLTDAEPGVLATLAGNTGAASLVSGPTPPSYNIPGLSQSDFTWTWNANTVGSFTIDGNAKGFDENNAGLLTAATQSSNMCTIQTKPVLSVVSTSENYTNVYRNQTGLSVEMQIQNTGEASVMVDAASLSFDAGTHIQLLASPAALPFLLSGNSAATFIFQVSVASNSAAVTVSTIAGSFSAFEVNNVSSTFGVSGGTTGAWDILAASGKCSANSGFTPEQYTFEEGMTVFLEFKDLLPNTATAFVISDPNGEVAALRSGVLTSNGAGICSYQFIVPVGSTLGQWQVDAHKCKTPSGTLQELQGVQYFDMVAPGQLTSTLTISPDSVELGDTVTLTMSLSNNVANGSIIYPATSSVPVKTGASVGNLSLISGPTPASVTVDVGSPATFTWTYLTTANTGVGSLTLTALATGIDLTTAYADFPRGVTSNTALSNRLLILSRDLALASLTLDLGNMVCGETVVLTTQLNNTGNTSLSNVNWQKSYPVNGSAEVIPYAYFSFGPSSGFQVATFANQLSFFTMTMPYNQPAGTYNCAMSVYDDLNGNTARDLGEPYDEFSVLVVASACRVVVAADKLIDLGGWPQGISAATQTFSILNGGNLNLEDLKFSLVTATYTLSEIFITPMNPGPLATDAVFIASVSAFIGNDPHSTYIATWSVWNDGPGSAIDTFQVKFSIGTKDFTFTPNPYDLGNATPTFTILDMNFDINNTGTLDVVNPKELAFDLSDGTNIIPAENLTFELPANILPGTSKTATVSIYIPAGTLSGFYQGWQTIFDDQVADGFNSGEANEVEKSIQIQLTVNPYNAIQVIPSTVDLGGLAPGEPAKDVGFMCKNLGNTTMASLTWDPTDLSYLAFTIPQADYGFTPGGLFSVPPGQVFFATITVAIDAAQPPGFYSGSFGWLFDDDQMDGRGAPDPEDPFIISCQVGSKEIQVTTTGPIIATGTPYALSTTAPYIIKNIGTLILATPKAALNSDLIDGANTIPSTAAVFTPALFNYMNPNQSKAGTWAVQVPSGQAIGTYTGTLKVWDDANNDDIPDVLEASDTISVELRVLGKRVISVAPSPLDFFFVPSGQSAEGEFILSNVGNVDILGPGELIKFKTFDLNPTVAGPPSISSANITFDPTPTLSNNLPVGAFVIATASVAVPLGQTSGPYEGNQIIYDDYNTQNGAYDAASEEFASLKLKLIVGEKSIQVLSPVNVGSGNPEVSVSSSFIVKNLTSIPLSKLKWEEDPLVSGANSIASSAITYSFPGPFSISSNGSRSVLGSVLIPPFQPAGLYKGDITVFEDEDGNNVCNGFEASATFELQITVNVFADLALTIGSLDAGTLNIGETSSDFLVFYQNRGNVPLNNLGWLPIDLVGPTSTINSGLISYVATSPPGILAIGETAVATMTIGPIPAGQAAETYSALQTIRDTTYPLDASASYNLMLTIDAASGLDIASGSVYQEIATATFNDTTDERFILSAWVCPGTGTARLSFVESLGDGTVVTNRGLEVNLSGNVTTFGGVTAGGVSGQVVQESATYGTLVWYRVFMVFDYHFDEVLSDETFLLLQNANPNPLIIQAIWFDGVQLEKALFPNQLKPTSFSKRKQLISPNTQSEIKGGSGYQEW